MAFVEIAPAYRELLKAHGLDTAAALLAWPGALVGGHADRHVAAVELPGGLRFFLKRERVVRWRDRFTSVWHGHGWASKSVREASLLAHAHAAGIGCPEVIAVGEDPPRAFLLLRAEEELRELRMWLGAPRPETERRLLARELGRTLAELHGAGFDHPDLYVKHILVGREHAGFRFCFLDWQRSRRRQRVPWQRRLRDLAAVDASLADALASWRLRLCCLRAYLEAQREPGPPLARAASAIRRHSARLLLRRKVRALRHGVPRESAVAP